MWHDDDGACQSNSRNEMFNQGLVPGSYVVTVNKYSSGGGLAVMQFTITCPDEGESLTPGQYTGTPCVFPARLVVYTPEHVVATQRRAHRGLRLLHAQPQPRALH